MTLRSEVRDLRSKLREFYDEYSRFTTSKVHHQDHAHQEAPVHHEEEVLVAPISTPILVGQNDDYNLIPSEPVVENTEPVVVVQEEAITPFVPMVHDLPITKSTKVVDTGPSYMDVFLDWFKVDWPMKIGGLVFIL